MFAAQPGPLFRAGNEKAGHVVCDKPKMPAETRLASQLGSDKSAFAVSAKDACAIGVGVGVGVMVGALLTLDKATPVVYSHSRT